MAFSSICYCSKSRKYVLNLRNVNQKYSFSEAEVVLKLVFHINQVGRFVKDEAGEIHGSLEAGVYTENPLKDCNHPRHRIRQFKKRY